MFVYEEEGEREEYEDSISVKTARSSLLRLLAVCSVTDVYNSYQRRQAHSRTAPEVPSSLAAVEADSVETGSGLTAEVEAADGEAEMDQKSLSQSWEGDVTECALTDPERSPAADNGMYPLAARYALLNNVYYVILGRTNVRLLLRLIEYVLTAIIRWRYSACLP